MGRVEPLSVPMPFSSRSRFLVGVLAWALASLARAADTAPLLPIETFFGDESIRQMALSPDGTKIALVAPNNGRFSIGLLDIPTGKLAVIVHLEDENIRDVFWKGNERLVFSAYVDGNEVPLLASTDLQGKSVKRILEPRTRQDEFSIFQGKLVDSFPSSDDHILIIGYTNESDPKKIVPGDLRSISPTVYAVNVRTAARSPVLVMDERTEAGFFDANRQQRFSFQVESMQVRAVGRSDSTKPWRKLRQFAFDEVLWEPLSLLADGRTMLLRDLSDDDRGALRALDLDSGNLGPVLFLPEAGEITAPLLAPKRTRLLGVRYEDTRRRTHWVDPKWAKIGALLDKSFPDHVVAIQSIADDEKRFIFRIYSDRDPGRYFLGDLRGDSFQVQPISAVRPAINPAQMSPVVPIQFAARDGLQIHGYLTKPAGKIDARTPLIVHPHGGPFGPRDSWGFDPEVQFLANRGYAVLQVNYRGSGGYGTRFEHAGYGEWGGKMQDDLTDAVKWCLAQGWGDPERVGIFGASYGGYATLAGVTQTPELYKIGINYVGVSDLRLITRWDTERTREAAASFERRIGRDPAFLAARSPVNFVDKIRVPTLHAYGDNDPRVVIENWTELEAQLKKHGKIYESVVEAREGHGFEKSDASVKFYRRVEAFLAKYMPSDELKGHAKPGELRVVEMPAKTGGE